MKKELLFLSPVMPQASNYGLAIRAFNSIKALSSDYEITLIVFAQKDKAGIDQKPNTTYDFCKEIVLLDLKRFDFYYKKLHRLFYRLFSKKLFAYQNSIYSKDQKQRLEIIIKNGKFDRIHVFRIYLVWFIKKYLIKKEISSITCDLDDIESLTRNKLSKLYLKNNEKKKAQRLLLESSFYGDLEKRFLPLFDRVYVCSGLDEEILMEKYSLSNISVLPNVISIPSETQSKKPKEKTKFVFLFLGNLNYYPNIDAVNWISSKLVILMKKRADEQFEIWIAGSGNLNIKLKHTLNIANIKYKGYIKDLGALYEKVDVIIVPINAGGGTRIKILEAMSYKKAIVSTSFGACGIDVSDGENILLADDPEAFCDCCIKLMSNNKLKSDIEKRAFNLVKSKYNVDSDLYLQSIL
ncbi:MAG: glycosyltransferase [Pseudomonadota bacterium]